MKRIITATLLLVFFSNASFAASNDGYRTYEVQKVLNHGEYIINGMEWKPKNSCPGIKKGDKVKFIQGNTNGNCVSAEIMNQNSNSTCKVWCERYEL